jgi:hypothetical protein
MNLDVFPEDIAAVEAEKMIAIQMITGSQYLRNEEAPRTPGWKHGASGRGKRKSDCFHLLKRPACVYQ